MYRPRFTTGQHQGYGQYSEQSLQGNQEDIQKGKGGEISLV